MKSLTQVLCLILVTAIPAAAADDPAELKRLQQVADEVRARRNLRGMGTEDLIKLVYVEHQDGIQLTIKDRRLVECAAGLEDLFKKEVLMSRGVARQYLSLQTGAITRVQGRDLLIKKLKELDVAAIELGDSALLLVMKSQAPR